MSKKNTITIITEDEGTRQQVENAIEEAWEFDQIKGAFDVLTDRGTTTYDGNEAKFVKS